MKKLYFVSIKTKYMFNKVKVQNLTCLLKKIQLYFTENYFNNFN